MTNVRTQIIVLEQNDLEYPYGLEWGDILYADNLWMRLQDNYYMCLKCRSGHFKKGDILDSKHFEQECARIIRG